MKAIDDGKGPLELDEFDRRRKLICELLEEDAQRQTQIFRGIIRFCACVLGALALFVLLGMVGTGPFAAALETFRVEAAEQLGLAE